MPNCQQTAGVRRLDHVSFELPKMQCACVKLAEKLRERLTCFAHSKMAIGSERIFSVVIVKWFAFLKKRSQRGRGGHFGNEVGTLRRDIEI